MENREDEVIQDPTEGENIESDIMTEEEKDQYLISSEEMESAFPFEASDQFSVEELQDKVFTLLDNQAYKTEDDRGNMVWLHKSDDSYLTHVGMERELCYLIEYDIDSELSHGLGFSTSQQRWYGWSHRALCGFGVGSTIEKGDCAYVPKDKGDFEDCHRLFWGEERRDEEGGYHVILKSMSSDKLGKYYTDEKEVPGCEVVTTTSFFGKQQGRESYDSNHWAPYPESYGKGTWTAKTLDDAKEMATDFKNDVS